MKRAIFDVCLFIFVFISPWWLCLAFILIGIFIFNNYYEFIFISIIIYALYATPSQLIISSPVFFAGSISLTYILIQLIKKNIILYKHEN